MARSSLFLFVLLSQAAIAAEPRWLKVNSANFELFTTAGERKARDTIQHFEKVRSFFVQAMRITGTPLPVRIIQFDSEKLYQPYQVSSAAAAYYMPGHDTDYIILGPAGRYEAVVHEYVHLLVRHSGTDLPQWFDEGFAELYSTLQPVGNKIQVGQLIPGRVQELIYRKWIPFDILFQVDHRSPLYNEKDRAGLFYSESWALTHMLYLAEEFRPRFGDFVSQISAGASTEQAVQKVYGKTPADLQQDLDRYLRGNRIMVAIFDIRLTASAEKPSVVPATPFESGMMLATLAMHTSRAKTAELELEKLAQDHPDRFEPLQALGYLRWRDNNHEQARELFGKAFDLGAASPKLLWDYARLEASAAGTAERVARILEKVLEAEPGNLEARLMLGQQHIRRERYGQALASLRQIRRVKPEQAYRLFYALAFSAARLEEWEAAERDAERAVQHGKTPAEKQAAERLLKYLQSRREPVAAAAIQESQPRLQRDATTSEPTPPDTIEAVPVKRLTLPVQGKFVHLECLGDVARMRIEGPEGKTLQLLMRDPGRIAITGTGAATIDLTCGPQPGKHVKVEYDPGDDQKHATVGEVVAIEFR